MDVFPKVRAYNNMTFADMKFTAKQVSWCQGIGAVPAIPAGEMKPGMYRVYNTGVVARILTVERAKSNVIYSAQYENGKTYTDIKSRATTLIPVCVDASGTPVFSAA